MNILSFVFFGLMVIAEFIASISYLNGLHLPASYDYLWIVWWHIGVHIAFFISLLLFVKNLTNHGTYKVHNLAFDLNEMMNQALKSDTSPEEITILETACKKFCQTYTIIALVQPTSLRERIFEKIESGEINGVTGCRREYSSLDEKLCQLRNATCPDSGKFHVFLIFAICISIAACFFVTQCRMIYGAIEIPVQKQCELLAKKDLTELSDEQSAPN